MSSRPIALYANKDLSLPIPVKKIGGKDSWLLTVDKAHPNRTGTILLYLENLGFKSIENLELKSLPSQTIELKPIDESIRLHSTDIYPLKISYKIPRDTKPGIYWTTIKILDEQLILRFVAPPKYHPAVETKKIPYEESLRNIWGCSFYEDSEGEHPITHISFGRVWENESVTKKVWMRNDDRGTVEDLVYLVYRSDVTVEGPDKLTKKEMSSLTITWTPGDAVPFGLNEDLRINGTLVID